MQERFAGKCLKDTTSSCWLWVGYTGGDGYGRLTSGKVRIAAHRASYEMHKGPIPAGKLVLHSCDVKACVNPAHLRIGTVADNVHDAMERGQFKPPPNLYGEQVSTAKLTEKAVRHIRLREMTARQYAALYGVGRATIAKIWRGLRWAKKAGKK